MTAHRCPHCLNLPLSQVVACSHCGGTGLLNQFPRPRHIERLSLKSWQGELCPKCKTHQQHESWYPRNDALTLIERVVCFCNASVTRKPFNDVQFYEELSRNNPNHPNHPDYMRSI